MGFIQAPKLQSTSPQWTSMLPTAQPISTSIAGFGSAGPDIKPEEMGLGDKLGTIGNVAESLAGLFSAFQGFKQTSLLRKNFDFQKQAWLKQFSKSEEDHARELADRNRNRKQVEDQTLSA